MSETDKVIIKQLKEENHCLQLELQNEVNKKHYFSFIEQLSTESMVIFNSQYHILWLSDSCLKLFNYQRDEINQLSVIDFITPNSQELLIANIANECSLAYEVEAVRKDGTTFSAQIHGKSLVLDGQKLRLITLVDITENKNKQRALARSYNELEVFFTNSVFGIVMLRGGRKIFRANQRFADMFGYETTQEVEGHGVLDFHLSEERHIVFGEKYYNNLINRDMLQVEYQFKKKDGSAVWISISGRAIDPTIPPNLDEGVVWILEDISLRKEMEEQLLEMATIDFLTQCYNRRHFLELAKIEYEKSVRYKNPLSVIILDIDYFKKVNDKFGHEMGDNTLQLFASICRKELRSGDILGRLGGEEFAVILPNTDCKQANNVAERLRIVVQNITSSAESTVPAITVSLGVACADEGGSLKEVIRQVDSCLYIAKENGRNQVCCYQQLKK